MRDEEIEIGDELRIREWADMAEEFGTSDDNCEILCRAHFVDSMMELCGKPFTVLGKSLRCLLAGEERWEYISRENSETGSDGWKYIITSDMLERVTNSDELSDSPEDFDTKFSALFA